MRMEWHTKLLYILIIASFTVVLTTGCVDGGQAVTVETRVTATPTPSPAPTPTPAPAQAASVASVVDDGEYHDPYDVNIVYPDTHGEYMYDVNNRSVFRPNVTTAGKTYNDDSLDPADWSDEKVLSYDGGRGWSAATWRQFLHENMYIPVKPELTVSIMSLTDYMIINHTVSGKLVVSNIGNAAFQGDVKVVANLKCYTPEGSEVMMGVPIDNLFLSVMPGCTNEFTKSFTVPNYVTPDMFPGLFEGPVYSGGYNVHLELRSIEDGSVLCSTDLNNAKVSRDSPSGPSMYN